MQTKLGFKRRPEGFNPIFKILFQALVVIPEVKLEQRVRPQLDQRLVNHLRRRVKLFVTSVTQPKDAKG